MWSAHADVAVINTVSRGLKAGTVWVSEVFEPD